MIWVGGEIVSEDALAIPATDRTFEHGLGLFETLRTWEGHATLLDRHRARMLASARALGLAIGPMSLPDRRAVSDLLRSEGRDGDALLRITCSGGSATSPPIVWMRAAPLPPPMGGEAGAVVARSSLSVAADDRLTAHKTLNYWSRRLAHEEGVPLGFDEMLIGMDDGVGDTVLEGTRTNLFVVADGRVGTPAATGALLPGIMRGLVLEFAARLGIPTWEEFNKVTGTGGLTTSMLHPGYFDEVFLTNSARGIIPVRRAVDGDFPAPGPVTMTLWAAIEPWLRGGGDTR